MRIHGIAGTIARTGPRFPLFATLALVAGLGSCRGGCGRGGGPEAATVQGRLAPFPVETQVVLSFDFTRLRSSAAAGKLAALAQQSQTDQKEIEAFARRTGLDPLRDVQSLVVAFPEEARRRGELGLVLRADHLDEVRLVSYVRDQLQKSGDDLVATRRGRRTLWSARRDPDLAGFFADAHTFVLGAGGWAARMADLADSARPSDSAATNLDLVHLAERAADGGHAIWAAALVPEETRRRLRAEPRFANAAAVMTLALGVDVGPGLQAALLADVTTAADAQGLAAKVQETLRDAKRNAQVLVLGLGPYLDGVTSRASGHTFELRATLTEPQLDDLIARLGAFVNLARQGRTPGFGP
jgi:hypothetical protein